MGCRWLRRKWLDSGEIQKGWRRVGSVVVQWVRKGKTGGHWDSSVFMVVMRC